MRSMANDRPRVIGGAGYCRNCLGTDSGFGFTLQREPEVFRGDRALPVLAGVDLTLTATQVFEWLQVKRG
jgi:hypothetical protein